MLHFFLQKINKYIVSTLLDHFYICRSVSFKLFDCRKSENLKSVNSLISRVSQQNCGVWTHPPSFFILVQYYYFISWNKLNYLNYNFIELDVPKYNKYIMNTAIFSTISYVRLFLLTFAMKCYSVYELSFFFERRR